jgi:cell division protein FtsI/penicillin-binding protein 2
MGSLETKGAHVQASTSQGSGVLTLDPKLQSDVEVLLRRSRAPEAAAVVIDVKTGRVLAWASVDEQGRDLVSRPYAPPASLFKVVTAAALIEDADVKPGDRQCYVGGQRNVFLRDLRKSGAGGATCSTFSTALGYSQNMVMAGLALRHLEAQNLQRMAERLGFNGSIPIDIKIGAGSSRVPSSEEGMARAAAGFGLGTLTPLEAAYMMTVLAREGQRPSVRLVEHIVGSDGQPKAAPVRSVGPNRALSEATARRLRTMLEVTTREGTASKSFRDEQGNRYLGTHAGVGKTGTLSRGKPQRLFSWYAGYAPANNPEVAVAVMLANDLRWWRKGPEVARDVLRAYFASHRVAGISHPIRNATAQRKK